MLKIYLIIINAIAFVLMLVDKLKARNKLWRIPETVLMGTALLGGSIGSLLGMHVWRHKTKKPKFSVGIPVILALQTVLMVLILSH